MKNHPLFPVAFATGALAVLWVAAGFVGTNFPALLMTLAIGAVYACGAYELQQFRRTTATLASALAALPPQPDDLQTWLDGIHPTLRDSVRLRIEGERIGLPGPALTPYLAGLLVMLGMLGTFIGMVATFNGAMFALDGSTDLAAIRAAIAAPVKGLGLAFGTSVAGVAASAMLGLMAALARRERLQAGQQLDRQIAGALRSHSLIHQRQETFKLLQAQAHVLPRVADQLQVLMAQLERMNEQLGDRLLANQQGFHVDMRGIYDELARSVSQSLQDSLKEGATAASTRLTQAVETALAGISADAQGMHARVADTVQHQLDSLVARFNDSTARLMAAIDSAHAARIAADSDVIGQLRQDVSRAVARDNRLLEERGRTLEALNGLLVSIENASREQRATIDALVARAAHTFDQAGAGFAARMEAEGSKLGDAAAQVAAGAIDVASLGDAFGAAVQAFGTANTQLVDNLRRIEAALDKSMVRSDEQLAYYVAQAREVIDLSLASQKNLFDELRQLPHRQPAAAGVN